MNEATYQKWIAYANAAKKVETYHARMAKLEAMCLEANFVRRYQFIVHFNDTVESLYETTYGTDWAACQRLGEELRQCTDEVTQVDVYRVNDENEWLSGCLGSAIRNEE